MTRTSRKASRLLPLCALAGLLAACAGTGIAGVAIEAGRKLLMDTAGENFGDEYTEQFSKLVDLMMLKTVAQPASASLVAENRAADAAPEAAPAAAPVPIELDVVVVREVVIDDRPIPVAVEDGGVLRDGVGRDGDGDNLKIRFETNVPCHVYAVWVDATAWATPIFPRDGARNPVRAGRSVSVPEGDDWFYLDDYRGVENLYFVASHEPLDELAELLAELEGQERAFRADVERPATVGEPNEVTRGLAGTRPGRAPVTASDGTQHTVVSQAFVAQTAGADLVVTRWFRHE